MKADAYGLPGIRVDGNDVLALLRGGEGRRRARARGRTGPTFLECLTYRLGGHSSSRRPDALPRRARSQGLGGKDPLLRHRAWLVARGEWSDEREESFLADAGKRITDAIAAVEGAPPPPLDTMFTDVFARRPPISPISSSASERGEPV